MTFIFKKLCFTQLLLVDSRPLESGPFLLYFPRHWYLTFPSKIFSPITRQGRLLPIWQSSFVDLKVFPSFPPRWYSPFLLTLYFPFWSRRKHSRFLSDQQWGSLFFFAGILLNTLYFFFYFQHPFDHFFYWAYCVTRLSSPFQVTFKLYELNSPLPRTKFFTIVMFLISLFFKAFLSSYFLFSPLFTLYFFFFLFITFLFMSFFLTIQVVSYNSFIFREIIIGRNSAIISSFFLHACMCFFQFQLVVFTFKVLPPMELPSAPFHSVVPLCLQVIWVSCKWFSNSNFCHDFFPPFRQNWDPLWILHPRLNL